MGLLRGYRNGRKGSLRSRFTAKKPLFRHDFLMMSLGFVMALFFGMLLFETLNLQLHWIGGVRGTASGGVQQASVDTPGVHGAAPQTTQQITGSRLIITPETTGTTYAFPGQKDVALLDFTVSPSADGFIHAMTFVLGNLAHPYDLKSLKLMLGDQVLGEVSFFEGKGSFQNLMVKLTANKLMKFSVLGTVSEQAQTGDRIMLQFADDRGIDATDTDGVQFGVDGGKAAGGQPVSVVGGPSQSKYYL